MSAYKQWNCEHCGQPIPCRIDRFVRVHEISDLKTKFDGTTYKDKKYERYHLECASKLNDLTDDEKKMLANPTKKHIIKKTKVEHHKPQAELSELEIQKQVNNELMKLEKQGLLTYICSFLGTDNPYKIDRNGYAKFTVIFPNKIIFVEIKKPTGTFSTEQLDFIKLYNKLGHDYCMAESVDDVLRLIAPYLRQDALGSTIDEKTGNVSVKS